MDDMTEQTVLVTGSTSGIGRGELLGGNQAGSFRRHNQGVYESTEYLSVDQRGQAQAFQSLQ